MQSGFGIGYKAATAVALGVLLTGCAASLVPVGIGNTALEDAADEEAELIQRVDDLFLSDGETQQVELPAGNATYDGLVHGFAGGGSGPDLEYYADLSLEVDFDTDGIGGTVDNFRTDLAGFTAPTGSLPVVGAVSAAPGIATLDFTATGDVTGADREADYFLDADGAFIGDAAEAARGLHESDFLWLTGPDTGDTSFSDGHWTAEQ